MLRTLTALPALAAGLAFSAPALAGNLDEPVAEAPVIVAPAPVAPVSPNWTGFYGGAELGYGNIDTNAPGVSGNDGVVGGLIAGYDYDFNNGFVLGGGVDYDWTDMGLTAGGVTADVDSILRVKLRGGYKIGNGLLYATGGWAQVDTPGGDEDGYVVGAGYEHMITDNISLGGEVLYHEFENVTGTTNDVDATTVQMRAAFRF
ncbi:porin family protein [Roseovarius sp. SCSIO 43702]|uniref:outer membrane protein n=1 Tax=Roseovarius sp. SCSIO 43702 TaxID=2823043 RepID=UPI001C73B288|nr:outer membrane beta-barrel protein [Roseovarius sp. SCSIO 43702]QYX58292.1 porin family protein [Roseovarius sp. SCSIO 43702]